jgi:hypothetical protein
MRSIFAANFDLETVSNDDRVKSSWLGVLNPFFRAILQRCVWRFGLAGQDYGAAFKPRLWVGSAQAS